MVSARRYTLSLSCPDRVGLIAAVSTFIADRGGWITEAQYHADQIAQRFFMRQEILAESLPYDIEEFCRQFASIAERLQMDWQITDSAQKKRVVILVSS